MSHPNPLHDPKNVYPSDNYKGLITVKPVKTKGRISKILKGIVYDGFTYNTRGGKGT